MSGDYVGAVERERGLRNAAGRAKTAAKRELRELIARAKAEERAKVEASRKAEQRKREAAWQAEFGELATAKWRTSKSGNPWCVVDGRRCVIFKAGEGWSGLIVDLSSDRQQVVGRFGSTAGVMRAMRDRLWPKEAA
jgi:hypothetical protein